jgi:hypothetical protein
MSQTVSETAPQTAALAHLATWFESLTPQTLATIGEVYAVDAHFQDPFNDVVGIDQITAIYAHMFANLTHPRFEITDTIEQVSPTAHRAFVAWQFKFEWRGQLFDIPGGTRFSLNQAGLVIDHIDYWDVAAGLYERLPLIGAVLRTLRRRMAATS